jgi:hypothetical protein
MDTGMYIVFAFQKMGTTNAQQNETSFSSQNPPQQPPPPRLLDPEKDIKKFA